MAFPHSLLASTGTVTFFKGWDFTAEPATQTGEK